MLLASTKWRIDLQEQDVERRAAVREFRANVDRVGKSFHWEEGDDLPSFRLLVRETLLRYWGHQLEQLESTLACCSEYHLRDWTDPEFPDDPYPLVQPYTHPDLFAGRDRELSELVAGSGGRF